MLQTRTPSHTNTSTHEEKQAQQRLLQEHCQSLNIRTDVQKAPREKYHQNIRVSEKRRVKTAKITVDTDY